MSTPTYTLDVLRLATGDDYSRGGLSTQHDRLTLVGWTTGNGRFVCDAPGGIERDDEKIAAPVILSVTEAFRRRRAAIIPAGWNATRGWTANTGMSWMAGGNFAVPGNGNVRRLIEELLERPHDGAVSIHDRCED